MAQIKCLLVVLVFGWFANCSYLGLIKQRINNKFK